MQHDHTPATPVAPGPTQGYREKAVFRTVPIPVSAFDHIKNTQRAIQARTGRTATFNEVFALIVHEHKQHTQNADNGANAHDNTAALLRR